MTAHRTYILSCDGCSALFGHTPRDRRVTVVLSRARAAGWHRRYVAAVGRAPSRALDLCPACGESGRAQERFSETVKQQAQLDQCLREVKGR